jgi:tetratricopeptide (TPR) repeat protein
MSLTLLVWLLVTPSIAISALLIFLRRFDAARVALLSPLLVAANLMLVSAAALADDKSDCLDSSDHDLRIKGCSAIIERDPKDVVSYYNRGAAHGLKGDVDRAIADYTKAIVLNPNYAPAYNSRGRAYASKGDYIRAVDDVTKAGEITAKAWPSPAVVKVPPTKSKEVAKPALPAVVKVPPSKSKEVAKPALPAVAKMPPAKPKEVAKPALPVAGKAPVVEKSSVAQKAAPVVEKNGKAPTGEKPTEDSWPAWAQSSLN